MILYLSIEEVLRLHFQAIKDFGGSHGVRDEGRLFSIEQASRRIVSGEEQYKTLFEKAAVYMRNIATDHPFVDGNKRTAVTVCGVFLLHNGCRLTAAPKELEDFAVKVATDRLDIPEIAVWLEGHSVVVYEARQKEWHNEGQFAAGYADNATISHRAQ
ncbi:MAG TPA: type II toxin-antitoxin system death-on-curing family toxin [Candidatus Saccharimonadales bacterium]